MQERFTNTITALMMHEYSIRIFKEQKKKFKGKFQQITQIKVIV